MNKRSEPDLTRIYIPLGSFSLTTEKGWDSIRQLLPLTVGDQRRIVDKATDREKPLILLMLSTGIHPAVLSKPKYEFSYDDNYYQWKRTKKTKNNIVRGAWSSRMRDKAILSSLEGLRGLTVRGYYFLIANAGKRAKITPLGPLRLRHTHFVNGARLGHDAFSISSTAATDLTTIQQYYTIGISEMASLSDSDRTWLKELMER
jgi:integrase